MNALDTVCITIKETSPGTFDGTETFPAFEGLTIMVTFVIVSEKDFDGSVFKTHRYLQHEL